MPFRLPHSLPLQQMLALISKSATAARGWCARSLSSQDAMKEAPLLMRMVSGPEERKLWVIACCIDALAKTDSEDITDFLRETLWSQADLWTRVACAAKFRDFYSILI